MPRAAARSIADSATSICARASSRTRSGTATRANAASAMPSDAEAWKSPLVMLRLEVRHGLARGKPAADGAGGQLDAAQGDRVASGGPHPEGVPVAVDGDARRVGRYLHEAVALDAIVVDEADRGQERRRRGRHRAEDLVAVDPPAVAGPLGAGRRAREVLARLALGGRDDAPVADDRPQRVGERAGAAALAGGDGDAQPPRERHHGDEVHVDADRDRGVAPGQAARGDDEVVDGADAQPAEADRHRGHEVAGVAQCADAVVRIRAVAVVGGGAAAEVLGEPLGEGDQVRAGRRVGAQFHVGLS